MRRFAPLRALFSCSLLASGALAPQLRVHAQDSAVGASAGGSSASMTATASAAPAPTSTPVSAGSSAADGTAHAQARRDQLLRRSNTYYGPVGGIHVVEAGSGPAQSFRLQVISDFFFAKDYLYDDDKTRYVGGALSLSVTPIEHLEISAATTTRSLRSRRSADTLQPFGDTSEQLNSLGDPYLDVKGYGEVARGVTLGGDVQVAFLTKAATDNVDYAGTSVGLRGNVSLDLREMKAKLPLELRGNVGYYFDESYKVVRDTERDRLSQLNASGMTTDTTGRDEFRQLAVRHERLAYGINRVDHASIALGLEAPLQLSKRVALHPIAEWELWIPVNRQDFDCSRLLLPDGRKVGGQDSCLGSEGVDTWPQRVTLGARLYPALPGFNLLAAVELGVGGTTNFVRELAPTAPYRVILAASYAVDPRPKPPVTVVKEVEKRVEVAPPEGHVRGTIVEQGTNAPVANAQVVFSNRELSPVLSDQDGHFASYAFAPGEVAMELTAEGYRLGGCSATIAPAGGDVQATCELAALPRVGGVAGRVLDANGAPVAGVTVQLTGAESRSPVSDAEGRFREENLPAGEYQARVEHEGFLISVTPAVVEVRKESPLAVTLLPKPKKASVTIDKTKLKLAGTIFFNNDTAELQSRSEPLLTEVADTLLRNPALLRLEVQGHTDNVGAPEHNLELSTQRADAVRNWLLRAGVPGERLVSQGYGADKPIAPNIGPAGRAKNRRVEFVILEREQVEGAPAAVPAAKKAPAAAAPKKPAASPAPAGPASAAAAPATSAPATSAPATSAPATPAPATPAPATPAPATPAPATPAPAK